MSIRRGHYGASLATLLVTGALLAGCGGSEGGSTTTALSQSEFATRAATICKPINSQIEGAAKRYLGAGRPTAQDVDRFVTAAVVPDTQEGIDALNALTPPSSQAQTYAAMLGELQSVNDQLKANPQLLIAHGDPFAKANQLAMRAGLDACAGD